jgi:hypothetical protein
MELLKNKISAKEGLLGEEQHGDLE